MNGQSPQMVNGMIQANGKNGFAQPTQSIDPVLQQRILQARAAQHLAQTQQAALYQLPNGMGEQMNGDGANGAVFAEQAEIVRLAAQAGFGTNFQAFMEARNKARIMGMARMTAQQQQQQVQQQAQANGNGNSNGNGNGNGNATPQPSYGSPSIQNGQMQLKLPPHATARLNSSQAQQQRA